MAELTNIEEIEKWVDDVEYYGLSRGSSGDATIGFRYTKQLLAQLKELRNAADLYREDPSATHLVGLTVAINKSK